MARKKVTLFAVNEQTRVTKRMASELRYDDPERATDTAKGLLCVAYLLESLSQCGNEPLDGRIAQGLAIGIQKYADFALSMKRAAA